VPDNNQAITKADLDQALGAAVRQLRAFADYNHSAGIRFAKLEADTTNIDSSTTKLLGDIERQMADFRLELIALEGHR
jgi:hypothetical protein